MIVQKKVGQFDNFENKYFSLTQQYPNYKIIPIMWFIDDSLVKNRNYYQSRMNTMSNDYACEPKLFYGKTMFDDIIAFDNAIWDETIKYLEKWKATLPDMPEINFDNNASAVFEEVKNLPPLIYRKLFNNEDIVNQIFPIIFPTGDVLSMLYTYFNAKTDKIYQTLAALSMKCIKDTAQKPCYCVNI